MASNPLKYTDLFEGSMVQSIDNLIKKLEELKGKYDGMASDIKSRAKEIADAMRPLSGATQSGRSGISAGASEMDTLLSKYKALEEELKRVKSDFELATRAQEQMSRAQQSASQVTGGEARSLSDVQRKLLEFTHTIEENARRYDELRRKMAAISAEKKREGADTAALTKRYKELQIESQKVDRMLKSQIKQNQAAKGSYNDLNQELVQINMTLRNMSESMVASKYGQDLLTRSQDLQKKLAAFDAQLGNYHRNVGNYASAWSGVGFATQQVMRELPSLAVGFNTFFLAISNNIPILVDEINAMKRANEELRASGKPTQSVLKELSKAIFSWQSLLVVGISLLSVYGKDIIEWGKNLFRTKEQIDAATEAARDLYTVQREASRNSQAEITRLRLLYNATQDTTRSMNERLAAVNELQEKYPGYLGNFSDEEILAGRAATSYLRLSEAILESARARARVDKMIEIEKQNLSLEENNNADLNWMTRTEPQAVAALQDIRRTIERNTATTYAGEGDASIRERVANNETVKRIDALMRNPDRQGLYELFRLYSVVNDYAGDFVDRFEKRGRDLQQIARNNAKIRRLESEINVQALVEDPSSHAATGRSRAASAASQPRDNTLELIRAYQDAMLELEPDSISKRRLAIEYQYGREIEDLKIRLKTEENLTVEGEKAINGQIIALRQQRINALREANEKWDKEQRDKQLKQLQSMRRGYSDDTREAIGIDLGINELNRRNALSENRLLPERERRREEDINREYDLKKSGIREREAGIGMSEFEMERALAESELELTDKTEAEKTRIRLEWEKKRIRLILSQNEAGLLQLTEQEVQTYKNQIAALSKQQNETKEDEKVGNLWDLVGIPKEYQDALNEFTSQVSQSLQSVTQARMDAAEAAVQQAQRETDAAREALNIERTARANGYANNVAMAQKELEQARKNEQKALAEKERAQKQQLALDSVEQMSSLVTASANIWKTFAHIPPLAVAMIAMMWASFAASKIKAAQLVKQQNTQSGGAVSYGSGGTELLVGGSHQSGRDVDLGHTADGRPRRGEGGEYLAVFNKRSSRRHGNIIRRFVDSVNHGTVGVDYSGAFAFPRQENNLKVVDMAGVEERLDKIYKQGEERRYTDANGNYVVVKGNHRRIYRR